MDNNIKQNLIDDIDLEVLPARIKNDIINDDYILSEIPDYILDDEEDIKAIRKRRDNFMKINDEKLELENDRMCKEMERQVDAEIMKELENEFEPMKTLADEDRLRARELVNGDQLISKAISSDIISLEEVVYFIDYYEIFALINKTKQRTVNTLNEISSLFTEEDRSIDRIRENIERTLSTNNSVLDLDFDYMKLKANNLTFVTSNVKKEPKVNKLAQSTERKPSIQENNLRTSNSEVGKMTKGRFQSLPKIQKKTTPTTAATSTTNKLMNSVELFNGDNKPVNLLTVRDNRREIKKTSFKSKGSDLFKFDTRKIVIDSSKEDLKKQFLEVFDMPKTFIEKDTKIGESKKNSILKRIDDARNYFKNKL
jgi:hypothetical protein